MIKKSWNDNNEDRFKDLPYEYNKSVYSNLHLQSVIISLYTVDF